MFHVGTIKTNQLRRLLHIGDKNVAAWLQKRFPCENTYEIITDVSRPIEMVDSKRTHDLPSRIAEDCDLPLVALYLKKNGDKEKDLIRSLERRGYGCIHYVNKNESSGSDSWIVWNWSIKNDVDYLG